jgi:hypothetical protein
MVRIPLDVQVGIPLDTPLGIPLGIPINIPINNAASPQHRSSKVLLAERLGRGTPATELLQPAVLGRVHPSAPIEIQHARRQCRQQRALPFGEKCLYLRVSPVHIQLLEQRPRCLEEPGVFSIDGPGQCAHLVVVSGLSILGLHRRSRRGLLAHRLLAHRRSRRGLLAHRLLAQHVAVAIAP